MLFQKDNNETNTLANELQKEEYEYKNKFGFLDELKCNVRTDEEFAKYKGYID